jgi:hypothetical protein
VAKSWYESLEDCEAGGGTLLSLGINSISILLVFLDVLLFCLLDRILGFFSSRPNWDPPPPPSPSGQCVPSPFIPGGTRSLAGEGVGGPNTEEGTDAVVLYVGINEICAIKLFVEATSKGK